MSNFFRIGSEGRNPLSFLLHGPVTSRSDDQVPNAPPAETAAEASDVLKEEYHHTVLKPHGLLTNPRAKSKQRDEVQKQATDLITAVTIGRFDKVEKMLQEAAGKLREASEFDKLREVFAMRDLMFKTAALDKRQLGYWRELGWDPENEEKFEAPSWDDLSEDQQDAVRGLGYGGHDDWDEGDKKPQGQTACELAIDLGGASGTGDSMLKLLLSSHVETELFQEAAKVFLNKFGTKERKHSTPIALAFEPRTRVDSHPEPAAHALGPPAARQCSTCSSSSSSVSSPRTRSSPRSAPRSAG
jgi:hypothetical protein